LDQKHQRELQILKEKHQLELQSLEEELTKKFQLEK